MKPSEIRNMSAAEINAKVNELRNEAMNLRFQDVSGQLTDYSRVREVRRDPLLVLSVAVVRKWKRPRQKRRRLPSRRLPGQVGPQPLPTGRRAAAGALRCSSPCSR